MIKIEFSGLSFFPDNSFKDTTNVNYRYIPVDDTIISKSVSWNGETEIVQNIFFDTFKLKFILREQKKNGFQKIAYAPDILITDTSNSKVINAKYKDVQFEKIQDSREFYICEFTFYDIDSKTIQNNIKSNDESENCLLTLLFQGSALLNYKSKFKPILKYNFTEDVVNSYKDKIVGYNKIRKGYSFLFFLNESELSDFYTYLSGLSYSNNEYYFILYDKSGTLLPQITEVDVVSNSQIGENLYKIELFLVFSNVINAPYN